MVKAAVYCLAGFMVFSALNGAENSAVSGDAALFAGKGSAGIRYFRLGELALENFDSAGAAEFFQQALANLNESSMQIQATDLLLKSLLAANRLNEAEKLLSDAQKNKLFANSDMLKLMQARVLLHKEKTSDAVKLLKELTARLDPDNIAVFPALELLSRALSDSGDYAAARKVALDMAVIAGDNVLNKFKALEGLIFLALANNDKAQAQEAYNRLLEDVPKEFRNNFADRMEKLEWLLDCHNGKVRAVQEKLLKAAESAQTPDPLLARIAYAAAKEANKDLTAAVKYARLAYKFAEGSFRQTALQTVIQLEIAGKFWQDALNDALQYKRIFPEAPGMDTLKSLIGDLYIQLGRTEDAIKTLAELCASEKADMNERCDAAKRLARLYQKQSKVAEASAMFKFAIKNIQDKAMKSAVEHEFGEYLYNLGRYHDAAEHFRAAAKDGSAPEKSRLFMAQSLYMLKSYEAAQKELAAVKSSADKDIVMRTDYLDALITEQLGMIDEAIGKFSAFSEKYAASSEAPEALFHAGTLALGSGKFNGAEMLQLYAKRYPGEKAANALYKALSAELSANKEVEGKKLLAELAEKYPESKFTVAGNFRMADFLRENKRYEEALNMLESVSRRYSSARSELIPEILYDRAVLYGLLNDYPNKLKALEELVRQYPDNPAAGRAFFMLGDLKAAAGDAEAALAAFLQAKKRSDGLFAYGCTGRAGDAAYTLYTKSRKEEYLLQARECYDSLLKISDLAPAMRMQTLYKLGKTLEESSDSAAALRKYREILYEALLCKRQGRFYPQIWSVKALDAALKLILQAVRETSVDEDVQQLKNGAERLLKTASELDLPGEDINKLQELVQKTVPAAR